MQWLLLRDFPNSFFRPLDTRNGGCDLIAVGARARLAFMTRRVGAAIAFRQFDPKRGFDAGENDVFRIPLDSKLKMSWALAPDGSHLAWIVSDAPDAIIHVVSLRDSAQVELKRKMLKPRSF
jgi:hypothetical protein